MLICVDVQYEPNLSRVGCVGFDAWSASDPRCSITHPISGPAASYEPGEFYRRELPCILAVVKLLPVEPTIIVVDGYVWLGPGRKGLGAHLFDALQEATPVVGVAKNRFRTADDASEVLRGESRRPLFVSAVGIGLAEAAAGVARMAGEHRIPTMIRAADRLARGGSS